LAGAALRLMLARPGASLAGVSVLAVLMAVQVALPLPRPVRPPVGNFAESLQCMAQNLYHEARGEGDAGMLAVGQVVMNRVADPHFPDDVCTVIRQGGERIRFGCQFSWWCDGLSDRTDDPRAWQRSLTLARAILEGRAGDPTRGALWYHADYVDPHWRQDMSETARIGRHIFYQQP